MTDGSKRWILVGLLLLAGACLDPALEVPEGPITGTMSPADMTPTAPLVCGEGIGPRTSST